MLFYESSTQTVITDIAKIHYFKFESKKREDPAVKDRTAKTLLIVLWQQTENIDRKKVQAED